MTATLARTHVETDPEPQPARAAVVARWHELRRIAGLVAVGLALFAGVVLAWPELLVVSALGVWIAVDATIALRRRRTGVLTTIAADITFTSVGLVAAAVPAPAIGMVVAYFVLVVAVLAGPDRAWPVGLYAVAMGAAASVLAARVDTAGGETVRSLVSGTIVVAVFGILTISMVSEFAAVRRRGNAAVDRRLEIADAIARASRALVAEDEASALSSALGAVREAMGVSAVFIERNVEDAQFGLSAVVVERATDRRVVHPSLDVRSRVPWSAMPGARAHLEGGAPFFYRVEEARGTTADRGGEGGLQIEVNVPITMHGEWVGVIGAADVDGERLWRSDDLVLLRTMADLTAAFWQRSDDAKVRDTLIGSLDGRLRYEEAIAAASRALLGEHASDLAPAMGAVGTAAAVDELVVTRTHEGPDGAPIARVVACWVSPGLEARYPVDAEWKYADLPDVRHALQRGEMAEMHDGETRQLVAGVEVAGAWFGTVGFVRHDASRPWRDRDTPFLRTFADMLGAFHERSENRARLERSLASKDQLIASVSHELRTPLTAVGGFAEELRSAGDRLDVADRDQLLGVIAAESAEMADLVEDLLVAARSDGGDLPVFPERIDLALLTRRVVDLLAIPADRSIDVRDEPAIAYADPVRVRQIIRNLLTNAVRYGGPMVSATFGQANGRAHVEIHDNGPGIPDEDRETIFEAYGRARSGRTEKASVGLGLTLSRRLAEIMGGELSYVGGDTCTFRLDLPHRGPEDR